ncbi:hypothetical protein [Nostoc sp. DSM 114167]|jgi:hypothetical protein|uniref:hypothetical protein n=1 Tax=Nostoc sp. DSM 114167 TaxID=3439050 RepID=UPI0040465E85
MSTLSVIGAMQSALDCAGKCDCCDKLQAQINAINARLSAIKPVNESALKNSIKASLQPDITTAVAGGIAVITNRYGPQITDAVLGSKNAQNAVKQLEPKITDAVLGGQAGRQARARVESLDQYVNTVSRTATTASTEAAIASKAAINAATEATGLRQLVNGVGSRIDGLGKAIGVLESKTATAVANAAKAIGISSEALGATARLAGRVLELFNLVATIFTLIEQLAVLNTLGERIDAVENGVVALGNDLSRVLGKLLGLQNRIGANETLTAQVKNIALDAKSIGEAANLKAGAAQVTSARAQGLAESALGNARQAQLTADGAVRNAAIANSNATTAYKKANEAQGIGEQAKRIAGDAFNKAGIALTTALTAIALYQGVKSLRGLQGIPGIPGRQGERGLQGIQGIPGIPGRDGVTTVVTLPGTPGPRGQTGRQGVPGIPGRNGRDVSPAEAASLRALIIQQHTQTRANSTAQHTGTRAQIRAFITTAFAPVLAILQRILGLLNAASNAAQLTLLNIINSKLGAQVTGGISGLVTSIAQNTYVEKALAVLTFATTLHNALMLTNNLGQTLGSIINTILGLILPKGLDGTPLDINSVLGKTTEFLIKEAVGEANYTKLSQEWAMANRIYQASANVFNALTNAVSTTINALEVIGSHTAKIGNALKYWGVLGQKAYEWFHPNPNFHNKYFTFLNNAEAGANTIQAVVQIPVSIVDAKNQIDSANSEFKSAIKGDKNTDGTPKESGIPTEENKDKKNEVEQSIANSQPFSFDFSDLFDGED